MVTNPKTVKEWVLKNDYEKLQRTLTDGYITSSLMKKAQKGDPNETNYESNNHLNQTSSHQHDQSNSLLGYVDASKSPLVQ